MRRRHFKHPRGFTLVELLVVIGIIAVLIAVLLPVLAGVAARGRDIKCQANLRTIIQAVHGYALENKGSMPWGYVYNRMLPNWNDAPGNGKEHICWASLIGTHLMRSGSVVLSDFSRDLTDTELRATIPASFQCPEADQVRPHFVSYAMNMLIAPAPVYEVSADAPGLLHRPPRQSHLLPESAVVWDTSVNWGFERRPFARIGLDIDGQRIAWVGSTVPQARFYTISDPFSRIPPRTFGQNMPVVFNMGSDIFYNRDPAPPPPGAGQWPYQGNLRFRHRKNTTCNVAFSDGSVRQFTAKMNPDKTLKSHDALRRYFMLKWPTGVRPHPNYPS